MLRKLLILTISFGFAQFAVADIATDIGNGVKVDPTTQNAKDADVIQEDAVEQLIQAGVDCFVAVQTVRKVYRLSPLETDSVINVAMETLTSDSNQSNDTSICDTAPLVALYSTGSGLGQAIGPTGTQGIADTGGSGGGSISPN